jgi:hypothetical protein
LHRHGSAQLHFGLDRSLTHSSTHPITTYPGSVINWQVRLKDFNARDRLTKIADFPSGTSEIDLLETLSHRDIKGHVVLQKAATIFQQRLSSSQPLQDAAMDLLRSCRAAKDKPDSSTDKKREEKAKKLYGIRASIVDLTSASVKVPQPCAVLIGAAQRSWYQSLRSTTEDGYSDSEISNCLKDYFQIDNAWTAFINHRQDANTLCEVPGTDNAARMIMEILNDVNGIIPDWLNTFRAEQEAYEAHLVRQKSVLQEVMELERAHQQALQAGHQQHKGRLEELMSLFGRELTRARERNSAEMSELGLDVSRLQQVSFPPV